MVKGGDTNDETCRETAAWNWTDHSSCGLLAFLTILLVREKHQEKEAGDSSVYGTLLSEYYDAVFSENGEAMQKLIAPEAYWTYVQEQYNETKEDEIAAYNQTAASLVEY